MELATEVHRVTLKLPRHELFGLAAQIRRSAVSIPSNIAESEIASAENLTDDVGKLLNGVLRGLRHGQATTLRQSPIPYSNTFGFRVTFAFRSSSAT